MKTFLSKAVLLPAAVAAFLFSGAVNPVLAQGTNDRILTIGTASVTGVYYPAGGAICRLVSRHKKEHGIRCVVEPTGGSIYNLAAIRAGEMDMGVVQSDWQFHAYNGTALLAKEGPDTSLRSVFSLHSEPFTVLARRDANIRNFDDLKGKRVNIGNQGSGMRATMEILMRQKGWTMKDIKTSELKASDQGKALCNNEIDAMIYAAGHPNGTILEVTGACDAVLVPVEGTDVDALLQHYPFYAYATIPGGMYAGNPNPVHTFGVKATLVTSDRVPEDVVYQVVKAVFDNIGGFKDLHPVFSTLDPKRMVNDGNTAPLHKGAEKYYRETGMLK